MKEQFTQSMFRAASDIMDQILEHPFVNGIADGTLSDKQFRYYMIQDYLYLYEYAKLYAIGIFKAENTETLNWHAEHLNAVLNGELALHREYMNKIGVVNEQLGQMKPAQASRSYTSYMISTAEKGASADISAIALACSWTYAMIGQKLAKKKTTPFHPLYGEWVKIYSGPEYQNVNQELIGFVEHISKEKNTEEKYRLTDIFVTCCRYELEFFDMAWNMSI